MARSHVLNCKTCGVPIMTRKASDARCRPCAAQVRENTVTAATFRAVTDADALVAATAAQVSDVATFAAMVDEWASAHIAGGMLDCATLDALAVVEYVGSLADRARHGGDPAALIANRDSVVRIFHAVAALAKVKTPQRRTLAARELREAIRSGMVDIVTATGTL